MSDRAPSKADQIRALREARATASGAAKPAAQPPKSRDRKGSRVGDKPRPHATELSERGGHVRQEQHSGPSSSRGKLPEAGNVAEPQVGPPAQRADHPSEPGSKRKKAPAGSFDKRAYQRELMRKRRAAAKGKLP